MLSHIRDILLHWDYTMWYYMNTQWHNAFFDTVVPFLRNPWFWSPVYVFLAIFMPAKFRRNGWLWCAGFIISFALSDQLSVEVFKEFFHRLRPCHRYPEMVHLLISCGGQYGFPSAHATNHFAIGIFSAITISKLVKWFWIIPLCWALIVSYAQVYVGVHYPLDVISGALLGTIVGMTTGTLFNRYFCLAGVK